jgi:transposase InsO family protein
LETIKVDDKRFTNVLGEPGPVVNRKCAINFYYRGFCGNKPMIVRESLTAFVHPCAQVDMILNLRYAQEKGIRLHPQSFSYRKRGQNIKIPFIKNVQASMAALVEPHLLTYEEFMEESDKLTKDLTSYALISLTTTELSVTSDQSCILTTPTQTEDPMDGMQLGIQDPRARQLLIQFADYIRKDRKLQLPPSRGTDDVELVLKKGARPPKLPWRTLAPDEEAYLQQEIKKLMEQGLIEPSNSKFASHVLFVRKKDGSLRFVCDYRAINALLEDGSCALPSINWLLSKITSGQKKIFSTLDCLSGYWQLKLANKASQELTAIQCGFQRFEWRCLPQGLRIAPGYYQKLLSDWFSEVTAPGDYGHEVFIYIDDILIATDTIDRHLYVLNKVFDILREKQFYLNRQKCAFFQTKVAYLGFQLSSEGMTVLPDKVTAVQKLLPPTSLKGVRSLLGLFGFYRKFIPKYAHISAPFQQMIRNQLFHWDAQAQTAFHTLKDAVTSAPVLRIPDTKMPFELMVDASDYACGAVLHQSHPSSTKPGARVKHVVEYLSHVFTKAEAKLSIAEKETLAVVYALQKFRQYLIASPQVTVFSDNAATCRLLHQGKTSKLPLGRRQLGYLQVFSEYRPNQLILRHIPGKLNYVADALSRCPREPENPTTLVSTPQSSDLQEEHLLAVFPLQEPLPIDLFRETIIKAYQEDDWTRALLKFFQNPSDTRKLTIAARRNRQVDISNCSLHSSGLIVLRLSNSRTATVLPYCPSTLAIRTYLIDQIHQTVVHGAHEVTLQALKRRFYWRHCGQDCCVFLKSCVVCQQAKSVNRPPYTNSMALPLAARPFQVIHIDICSGFPTVHFRNAYGDPQEVNCFVTIVCAYSKMVKIILTKKKGLTAEKIADMFYHHVVLYYGLPDRIISDRGQEFVSAFFHSLAKHLNVSMIHSSSYSPQTNGQVERYHSSIIAKLRSLLLQDRMILQDETQNRNWASYMAMIEFSLNTSYHTSIRTTPFELLLGYTPKLPLGLGDALVADSNPDVQDRLHELQQARLVAEQIMEHNQEIKIRSAQRRLQPHSFKVGDLVLVSIQYLHLGHQSFSKILPRYIGPFTIRKMVTPNSTLLFWQDLCHAAPKNISQQEAKIIESFKRSRPIIHVRWLRKFVGPNTSETQATMLHILEHRRRKHMDIFLTEYQDGSKQWLTQDQIMLAKGASWFNTQIERLSEVQTETLIKLKRQIAHHSRELANISDHKPKKTKPSSSTKAKLHDHADHKSEKRVKSSDKAKKKLTSSTSITKSARWKLQNDSIPLPRQLTSGRISRPKKRYDL